ncbi:MAG: transcriptional repressor [Bacteroidia bacterium]|nr:transcriptional repressor [Bacteroidia bacterium]|tara:strand:+ start:173 stop:670 length:498 start_codon:yes stop_codon:yes gene_type:complete
MKNLESIKENVKQLFTAYLEKKGQRRTPERYAILDEIYSNKKHFDVDTLYIQMKNRNYHVSRATVYNTLDLLQECGLVIKHQFGQNMAQFEQAYGYKQHDHIICNTCSKVMEFCDPRIQQITTKMAELLNFEVSRHSLNLYGDPQVDKQGLCMNCDNQVKVVDLK